ncbi:GTP cyclohydrolase I FolE2 [Mycolicibacterium austroafricanum]|uniref:GTP cyclohydrolase I FolE2 n=1 Tax=Mycolicibacterium austroafricanum TaxID=39687 RepID=UPI0018F3FE90|nr:GTP cyclohydrolase, FolE2/MptA family [Mycolicibacterium austroafricanum]QZY47226.1 GTP cyclohydrolase, FolE2/MptA family [Mycolicibacterium austroafricanum]
MSESLPDVQSELDVRGVPIDEVGISGLRYPVTFDDGVIEQSGIANIELTVGLSPDRRGTHMSRMVQAVEPHLSTVHPYELHTSLKAIAALLEASDLSLSLTMPVATYVESPVTANSGYQVHDLSLHARLVTDRFQLACSVTSDVTTLCPCSKEISDYGAHNQRSRVLLSVDGENDAPYPVSVGELVELIRDSASCPVYPVVKRPDERAITMAAYDNPKFVEDLIRDLHLACRSLGVPHKITARNIESIHSHDAVARLAWKPSN